MCFIKQQDQNLICLRKMLRDPEEEIWPGLKSVDVSKVAHEIIQDGLDEHHHFDVDWHLFEGGWKGDEDKNLPGCVPQVSEQARVFDAGRRHLRVSRQSRMEPVSELGFERAARESIPYHCRSRRKPELVKDKPSRV